MRLRTFLAVATGLVFLWLPPSIRAQWITQQIKLTPGYNPIYLQVTPANGDCEAVFGSVAGIQHIWMYNRYLQTATFASSPTEATASQDHWLTWFPKNSAKGFLSTLSQVRGGQAYLVYLATNAAPVTVTVLGIPAPPRVDWIPFDLVLAGFPIAETGKVTFYQFLKDTPEVSTTPGTASGVYSINPLTARETQIRNPDLSGITPGRAYWTRLGAHSDNPFPVRVIAPGELNSVQFPQDKRIATITLVNSVRTAPQTIRLRLLESETAPEGMPKRIGSVPVALLVPQADGSYLSTFLSAGGDVTLAPGETKQFKLGLAADLLSPTTETNATYQSVIEVTEATHGFRQLVPVVSEVPGSGLTAGRVSLLGIKKGSVTAASSGTVANEAQSAGLWIGSLTLSSVNQPGFAATNNPDISQFPPTTASPLEVRALIHVDSNGVSRLLHQVFFAQVNEGSNQVVRMFSNQRSVPAGGVTKARVSAPSWPALAPASMSGAFGDTLSATLVEPFNDRVNPFVHRYHPDHNNLAEDFKATLASGQESFDISREVKFIFGATYKNGSRYSPAVPSIKFTGAAGEYARTSGFTNTAALTVQFWANVPTNVQRGATVALLTNSLTRTQFKIAFQTNTGALGVTVQNGAGAIATAAMTNSVPLGQWFNFIAAYDGEYVNIYLNGELAGFGQLPKLENGLWDAAWIGNSATTGTASFIGEVHDFVARNGSISLNTASMVMATPDIIDPTAIQIELQGDARTTNVVNRTPATLTIALPNRSLVNLSAAPATPLWTFGSAQGFYTETITGLRKQAIRVHGSFQMTRVSQDSTLR